MTKNAAQKAMGYAALLASPILLSGCLATGGAFQRPEGASQDTQHQQPSREARPLLPAGIYADPSCAKEIDERSDAGRVWATTVATTTNLHDSCVKITIGQLRKGSDKLLDPAKKITEQGLRLSIPSCSDRNMATSAIEKLTGAFDRNAQRKADEARYLCQKETAQVGQDVARAVTGLKAAYTKETGAVEVLQTGRNAPKVQPPLMVVSVEGAKDLTTLKLPNFSIPSAVPRYNVPTTIPGMTR